MNFELGAIELAQCVNDGGSLGDWTSVFAGYGCNSVEVFDGVMCLHISPEAQSDPDLTKSGLIVGPEKNGDLSFTCRVFTAKQLRTGSEPNFWEVGWVVWNYTSAENFYYFILKPNGWELGKRDPNYDGGQRFLQTGSNPFFPIQTWYEVEVSQSDATIFVSVDGDALIRFTDDEDPYLFGQIGVYSEDAKAYFDVHVSTI